MKVLASGMMAVVCLVGCSGSGGGSGDSSTESLSYDISEAGDRTCEVKKSFTNKADYCRTLKDYPSNDNGCGLSSRQQMYKSDCGNDFDETNYPGKYSVSGWDDRLQKSCDTAKPAQDPFPRHSDYCKFLANEAAHQSCHWNSRYQEFQDQQCAGSFSNEPARAPVASQPGPQVASVLNQIHR